MTYSVYLKKFRQFLSLLLYHKVLSLQSLYYAKSHKVYDLLSCIFTSTTNKINVRYKILLHLQSYWQSYMAGIKAYQKDHAFLHDPCHLFLLIRFFIYEAPMLFLLVLLNHTLMFLTSFIVINRHKQDITCIAQNRGWIFSIFDLLHGCLCILIPF